MKIIPLVPGVYQLSFGFVNAFLIDDGGLTLIDTGVVGSAPAIFQALGEISRRPDEIRQVILTHLHADHVGSARAVKEASGAKVYMHPLDTQDYQQGRWMRPRPEAHGLINRLVVGALSGQDKLMTTETTLIDGELNDGQTLPFTGGLQVIYTPGHTAGHVVLLWPKEGNVLFGGDACGNFFSLKPSMLYEDFSEGMRSLAKIASLKFDTACLSHGRVIHGRADEKFRQKWELTN